MPTLRFDNHDACGDYKIAVGRVEFQVVNTATNIFFVAAGLRLAACARSREARQSGTLLLAVGWFSAVYHATSSWGGFLLDIAAMAAWAAHLIASCQVACEAAGCRVFRPWRTGEPRWDGRFEMAVLACACALSGPFVAFEIFDANPVATWNIWANSFLVLVLLAAVPAIFALFVASMLQRFLARVVVAIAAILLGVACTQLIHLLCVPGDFTAWPLHSLWHFCAASSAYCTVTVLDDALTALAEGPAAGCSLRPPKERRQ